MISITIEDRSVLSALQALSASLDDLTPAMRDIGEHLSETTHQRFVSSTGPDGQAWIGNSEVTILQYLGHFGGSFKKDGSLSKKGSVRYSSKKPLIGETRSLESTIHYVAGSNFVEIGSPMIYSAMQQFGGSKSEFPHLWGDIPARPFLGLSGDDERAILDILDGYLRA